MTDRMPSDPILKLEGLTKHFDMWAGAGKRSKVYALDGVTLELARGTTLGIVGESGSGKTTLARCMLRLEEPTSGSLEIDGVDFLGASHRDVRRLRRRIQMVFQDPLDSINPRFTCRKTLKNALRHGGIVDSQSVAERSIELLEAVGLGADDLGKHPHQMSGGQQQRLGIARALAVQPSILVLDEPTASLDVTVSAQIIDLLLSLQRDFELSYVWISHDLRSVRRVAHDVAVMYLGNVVEIGSSATIFDAPQHPYLKALIDAIPVADPDREHATPPLEGEIPSPSAPPSGCNFRTRCPIRVERCHVDEPTLQAVSTGSRVACHVVRLEEAMQGYAHREQGAEVESATRRASPG